MDLVFRVPFLIGRLAFSIGAVLVGSPLAGWRARRAFRRSLRRAGLTRGEADALADAYRPGIGLRDLARAVRIRKN
jgi:hypothetical protein